MIRKLAVALLCCLACSCDQIVAYYNDHSVYAASQLSQEAMLADLDQLESIVREVSPHLVVSRLLFGVDADAVFAASRAAVVPGMDSVAFYRLVNQTLQGLHGHHTWVAPYPAFVVAETGVDSALVTHSVSMENFYRSFPADENGNRLLARVPLEYLDGAYIAGYTTELYGTRVPGGSILSAIDGVEPNEYVNSRLLGNFLPWDGDARRYYSQNLFMMVFNSEPGVAHRFEYTAPDGQPLVQVLANPRLTEAELEAHLAIRPKAEFGTNPPFFPANGVLYVKLQMMDETLADTLIDSLRGLAPGNAIQRIIVDIRDNPGGSDYAWHKLFAYLTGRPIQLESRMGIRDSALLRRKLPFAYTDAKRESIACLDGAEYLVTTYSSSSQAPADSLGYTGPIFLLVDNIYSSAGSCAEYGRQDDQILVLGRPSGHMLGLGVDPLYFSLEHSQLNFTIEPVIDLSNVQTAQDVMHDVIEQVLDLSAEDMVRMRSFSGDLYGEAYLFTVDAFVRAAVDL